MTAFRMYLQKVDKITILKLATFCVFLGRAAQHIFWDAPLRTFFWDEDLLKPIVENVLHMDWNLYVTSPYLDAMIQGATQWMGFLYFVCVFCVLRLNPERKISGFIIFVGFLFLCGLSILIFKERFFQWGILFELGLQTFCPLFLLVSVFSPSNSSALLHGMKLAASLTFIGHGLFAVGFYPVPGQFYKLLDSIFGLHKEPATDFLLIAGLLDFLVAGLIFFRATARKALLYMVIWGLATAFARVIAGVYQFDFLSTFLQSWFHSCYRLPHGLIPLFLWVHFSQENQGAFVSS